MSDPNEVEKDLREYLEKETNLRKEDKLTLLKAIFNKHLTLSMLDSLLTYSDLQYIISNAKSIYTNQSLPMEVSGKRIDNPDLIHVALIEAFVSHSNKNHLLKRLIKVDYT